VWSLLACGSIAAIAVGGYRAYLWAHRAPQFGLKQASFKGLHHAQEAELFRLAGLKVGQNLFELEPAAIERAIAAHPWVDQVHATRRFPGALSVSVKEHHPAAVVALGELYLVDSEGRPFKKVQTGDPTNLPLITGMEREQFVESPERSRLRLREMLSLAETYAQSDAARLSPLGEIRIGRSGVALVTAQGEEIRIGEGDSTESFLRLKKVHEELERRGLVAQVIHLENRSRPGWVAVKLANAVPDKKGGPSR
jgi:cell division protein FtsQ